MSRFDRTCQENVSLRRCKTGRAESAYEGRRCNTRKSGWRSDEGMTGRKETDHEINGCSPSPTRGLEKPGPLYIKNRCNNLTEASGATMPVASSVYTWGPLGPSLFGSCKVTLTASGAHRAVFWSGGTTPRSRDVFFSCFAEESVPLWGPARSVSRCPSYDKHLTPLLELVVRQLGRKVLFGLPARGSERGLCTLQCWIVTCLFSYDL